MKDPIISLTHLGKEYPIKIKQSFFKDAFFPKFTHFAAVKDISFQIHKGESVAILGPNGAGKTTTMKMLSGLLYPSSGKVEVLGYTPFDRKEAYLRSIGMVMGNRSGLSWDLSANQNFELLKKIYQIRNDKFQKRVKYLSELLDVTDLLDRPTRKLSLGERMKMEMIASIIHEPDIVYLDEPTIGLDVISKQKIRAFLRQIQRETGITVLLTSHDMDDVEQVCDRVIVINKGELIFDGQMHSLLKKYRDKKYLKIILGEEVSLNNLKKYGNVIESKPMTFTVEIKTSEQKQLITSIINDLPVEDIDIIPVPLEEIITDMFKQT